MINRLLRGLVRRLRPEVPPADPAALSAGLTSPAPRPLVAGRGASKLASQRHFVALALAAGEHIHVVEAGGALSCPGGLCTPEQLRRPEAGGYGGARAIVDEAQRLSEEQDR